MVSPPNPPAPQLQSTPTVSSAQEVPKPSKPNAEPAAPPSKPKNRNRNRKKAAKAQASDGAPPASVDATRDAPSTRADTQSGDRTSFPWRGSGRGRGRGGSNATRGGAGAKTVPGAAKSGNPARARGFSTVVGSSRDQHSDRDDAGVKVQRTPLFKSAQTGATGRRGIHTDDSQSDHTSSDARRGGGSGRGGGRGRGRGRGKGKGPLGGDRGVPLLNRVVEQAGEDNLEAQIQALYDIQRPSPESVAAREHLISELTGYLNRERFHWGHPHSPSAMPLSIEPFGSVRFGLGTSTSDLDLCLLDPYRPNGFEDKWYSSRKEHMQDLPDIYQMRKMANSLYRAGLDNIHPIPDAAVPICKFEVEIDGQTIQADLNTNERLGVYNSRLLNSYCNLHPLVRPLSVFIKFWASQRGLNNPAGDQDGIVTFSSYALILLVVSYLQRIKLLPNLQDEELIESTGTERNRFYSTPKAFGRRGKLRHLIRSVGWDVTFVEYDHEPEGFEADEATLVDLARGFFHYWGEEFDPRANVVSVANGAPFARERQFGDFATAQQTSDAASKPEGAESEHEGVSKAEQARQEMEDLALEAFAEEEEQARTRDGGQEAGSVVGNGAAQVDDPSAEVDAIAQALSSPDRGGDRKTTQNRPRADSRSSSPIPYGDFSEPDKWTEHLLVVQDPFILTRNCAGNVRPDWVDELRIQMRRARDLIDEKAPLSKICLHHCSDPDYLPVALAKKRATVAEAKRQQEVAIEKRLKVQSRAQEEAQKRESASAVGAAQATRSNGDGTVGVEGTPTSAEGTEDATEEGRVDQTDEATGDSAGPEPVAAVNGNTDEPTPTPTKPE